MSREAANGGRSAESESDNYTCGRCYLSMSMKGLAYHHMYCTGVSQNEFQNNKRHRTMQAEDFYQNGIESTDIDIADDAGELNHLFDGFGFGNEGDGDGGDGGSDKDSSDGSDSGDADGEEIKRDDEPSLDFGKTTRFMPLEGIDTEKHSVKYLNHQNKFLKGAYGSSFEGVDSFESFSDEIRETYTDRKTVATIMMRSYISKFGIKFRVSKECGDAILELLNYAQKFAEAKIPTTWQTIVRSEYKQVLEMYTVDELEVPWPDFMEMDKFSSAGAPPPIKLVANNILCQIAQKLVDPEITLTNWHKHLSFVSKQMVGSDARTQQDERCYSDIMTSTWAEMTEREMLARCDYGTLLPVIVNSDGVAVGGTKQSVTTCLGTFGNCSDTLLNRIISKFSIGYLSKLNITEEELTNHLLRLGKSKFAANEIIKYFDRSLERSFWELVMTPLRSAAQHGVYMRVLGVPGKVLVMFPYLVCHLSDEPGQKRLCGMKEAGTTHYCIHCMYSNADKLYDRTIHKLRNYTRLKKLCIEGEKYQLKKFKFSSSSSRLPLNEAGVLNLLSKLGVRPSDHPFFHVRMGHQNNLYKTPYDLLHTFCGGIIKSLMLMIGVIIDRQSVCEVKNFKHARGTFDQRLGEVPSMSDCLPHVSQTNFNNGYMHNITSKSKAGKATSTGSSSFMRSKHYVTLLLHTYFCIGDRGDVVSSADTYTYKYQGVSVELGNVTKKILTCIEVVLSTYFQCKKSSHNVPSAEELKQSVQYMYASYFLIYELQQIMQGLFPDVLNVRKPHFPNHFYELILLFGALSHFDTESWESAHRWFTTSVWAATSRRKDSVVREMHNIAIIKNHFEKSSAVGKILSDSALKWGLPTPPKVTSWKRMKCGSRIQLRIDPDVNTNKGIIAIVPQPNGKEPVVVPLLDFAKHTAYRSPHGNIITLLENVGESVEDIIGGNTTLYLLEGMKYAADVDSGLGEGKVHCSTNFSGSKKSRHDFVEVDTEYEDPQTNRKVSRKQLAQVISFLEIKKGLLNSSYYAFLQYLEEEILEEPVRARATTNKKKPKIDKGRRLASQHRSIFRKYKWEYTNYGRNTAITFLSIGLVEVSSILQVVWVMPDFASMEEEANGYKMRLDYHIKQFSRTDRYWHVPRSFTDRSGWNNEIEAHARWRKDDDSNTEDADLREHLLELLGRNQAANQANPHQRDYDMDFSDIVYNNPYVLRKEDMVIATEEEEEKQQQQGDDKLEDDDFF